MTNEEVSRYIHERILKKCWHDWGKPHVADRGGVVVLCERCKVGRDGLLDGHFNPQYCSDDSPRSLLNEVVAKVAMSLPKPTEYGQFLLNIIQPKIHLPVHILYDAATATAEQIARACVEAWEAREV